MIPINEIRQVIISLSYEESKDFIGKLDSHAWWSFSSFLRTFLVKKCRDFSVRGKYRNHPEAKHLKLNRITVTPSNNPQKFLSMDANNFVIGCDVVNDTESGGTVSWFVQVFIQFDEKYIEENLENFTREAASRIRKSPNLTKEQKVYFKLKYNIS